MGGKYVHYSAYILVSSFLLWPMLSQADYADYIYTDPSDSNYHYKDTTVSADGTVIIAIGGADVSATEEVVVFSPTNTKPIIRFDEMNDTIFDVALSADGSTAVACGGGVWLLDIAQEQVEWAMTDDYRVWDTCDISADGEVIVAGNRQSSVASWNRSSNEIVGYWTFNDGGFVDRVAVTSNGQRAIAENGYSYGLIDLAVDDWLWERQTDVEIYDVGLNSASGHKGFIDLDDGALGTDVHFLRGINMTNGHLTWKKRFRSYNTPRVQMSTNGQRIMLTTNDQLYGLNGSGKTDWTFRPAGQETYLNMSADGKFVTVTEGLDYIYFFDWDYPKNKHRAYQIDRGTFPGAVGVSADGSTVAYADSDLVVQQVKPGILVDTTNLPVYRPDGGMDLRYFVSNPGQAANLKIRTSLSLPQIALLSDLGATVNGDPKTVRSKLLDYANATLPGYEVVDEQKVTVAAHDSNTINTKITVPDMIMPDWVGDFLELIGLDDVFGSLMGDYAEPMNDLMNSKVNDTLTSGAEAGVSGVEGAYALLGVGQVELYDAQTNEVYSTDTFFFMYLVF